jgi:Fe-S cluster assembly protein SufD
MATNIFIKKKERLDYFAPNRSYVINFNLRENSFLRFYNFNFGRSTKSEVNIIFEGKNARAELYGLYLPSDNNVIENNVFLYHRVGFGKSSLFYYGILFDEGKAFFEGRILVDKKAQKTDAYLESKNILLDKRAQIMAKPFLEIFADDIKCTHAFSSFQLEEDEVFYLQSRGIDKDKAKKILLESFAKRIISKIDSPKIRENLCAKIFQFLEKKLAKEN